MTNAIAGIIVLFLLGWIPGELVWPSGRRVTWEDHLASWSSRFLFGIGLNATLGSLCHLAGLEQRGFLAVWIGLVAAGLLTRSRFETEGGVYRSGVAALLVIAILGSWGGLTGGILRPMCDAWIHIGRIHRGLRGGGLIPATDPNSGFLYFQYAIACRWTRAEVFEFWILSIALLLPAFFGVHLSLYRSVLRKRGVVLVASFLTCITFEGIHLDPLRELVYPRYVSWLLLVMALQNSIDFVRAGNVSALARVSFLVLGIGAVHTGELPLYLVSLACILPGLFRLANRSMTLRAITCVSLQALLSVFVLMVLASPGTARVFDRLGPAGQADPAAGGPFYPNMIYIASGVSIADPSGEFGQVLGRPGFLAIGLALLLLPRIRTAGQAWLVGSTLVPALIAFTPGLPHLFMRLYRVPEVFHRLALLVPAGGILAWAVCNSWPGVGGVRRVRTRLVILGLILVSVLPSWALRVGGPVEKVSEARDLFRVRPLLRSLEWLDRVGGESDRFLSDPLTSYYGMALTRHQPVDTGDSRSLWTPLALEASPSFQILGPSGPRPESVKEIVLGQGVDWIIHAPIPALDYTYAKSRDQGPYLDPQSYRRLDSHPQAFELMRRDRWARIYRVHPDKLEEAVLNGVWGATRTVAAPEPSTSTAVNTDSRPWMALSSVPSRRGFRITEVSLSPDGVLDAGRVHAVGVRLVREGAESKKIWCEIRLVSDSFLGWPVPPAIENIVRFLWERLSRRVVRITGRVLISDHSESGEDVVSVLLPVPHRATPGSYEVFARVRPALKVEPKWLTIGQESGWQSLEGVRVQIK